MERMVQETGEDFHNKTHILYINGQYKDSDAVGRLMENFFAADPSKKNYNELADRAKYFKEPGKGAEIISDIMGEFEKAVRIARNQEIALNLIRKGSLSQGDIADVTGLSLAEVEELTKKKTE